MSDLHGDFETRSTVDLLVAGLDNYAKHPTTAPWCLSYAFDQEQDVGLWALGDPLPPRVRSHIESGGTFVAHNAPFELAIWNNYCVKVLGWPPLRPEQTRCTMAMSYAMALPGSLDNSSAAVGLKFRKDMEGHRLMKQMCKPRFINPDGSVVWWDDLDLRIRLGQYCVQDTRVEQALDIRLMQLSNEEKETWILDYKINQRGVMVDRSAVAAAIKVAEVEQIYNDVEIRGLTGNAVSACTAVAQLKTWVKEQGIPVEGLAKADIVALLEMDDLPENVRTTLWLRQEGGKTSLAKLMPMLEAGSSDGRLRGMFQYHGAGTGRWAGRRVQLHNMIRPKEKFAQIEWAINVMMREKPQDAASALRAFFGRPAVAISECLRSFLIAGDDNELLAADFANIEGRGLAWLAGEEWKLDAFRAYDAGVGADLYLIAASRIWGGNAGDYSVDGIERQHGKVAELACGYGGGVGAFQTMAKTYLVIVADDLANQIKTRWREAHPATVRYWDQLETAAMEAVRNPGSIYAAGPKGRQVFYKVQGSFLWCLLPSKRPLCYSYPKILPVKTPWGAIKDAVTYMVVVDEQQKKKAGKIIPDPASHGDWQRVSTYGGKLSENITQAICRDLLVHSMKTCEAADFPVHLHVHDEIVCEVPLKDKRSLEQFSACCSSIPTWAEGLPVVAKGWRGKRYRK